MEKIKPNPSVFFMLEQVVVLMRFSWGVGWTWCSTGEGDVFEKYVLYNYRVITVYCSDNNQWS